ncbi:MAG: OmpA family protein [Alphaproteobacteria bacterium]|nr:OmpA family protein [Alphaproteobacteria bacterium]
MLSRITAYVVVGAAALALGGCASSLKDAQMAEATGSDFQMGLIEGYKKLADMEAAEGDWRDARVFADRVLAVAGGADVMPEQPSGRALPADAKLEVEIAQARLETILDGGGRDKAGKAAAMAQVGFDCWLQELEENIQPGDIANCKAMFEEGATAAEEALRPPPPKPVNKGPWEVYFAWDSAAIDGAAQQEINKAYTASRKLKGSVVNISGHTDSSGSSKYNQKLSEMRAKVVYEVFTLDLLVPEDRVTIRAVGEGEPAIKTPDNTREVLNRRVVIHLSN